MVESDIVYKLMLLLQGMRAASTALMCPQMVDFWLLLA